MSHNPNMLILYLRNFTKIDITFALNKLSRYTYSHNQKPWKETDMLLKELWIMVCNIWYDAAFGKAEPNISYALYMGLFHGTQRNKPMSHCLQLNPNM